jgi:hypothetical protein
MEAHEQKVLSMVERELAKDPTVDNKTLQAKAARIDSEFGQMEPRRFHARFPLQVKRRMKAAANAEREKTRKTIKDVTTRDKARRAAKAPAKAPVAKAAPKTNGKKTTAPRANGVQRDKARKVFYDFAEKLVSAEDRVAVIKLLSRVDSYVEKIL